MTLSQEPAVLRATGEVCNALAQSVAVRQTCVGRPPGVCRIRISSRILEHLHGTYFVDFSRIFDATVDLTGFRRRRQYLQIIFRIGNTLILRSQKINIMGDELEKHYTLKIDLFIKIASRIFVWNIKAHVMLFFENRSFHHDHP